MTTAIVFETHSTTTDNERGIATGWLPGALSDAGKRQAAELGDRRGSDGIALVFTSDSGRAMETAKIAFGGADTPVRPDPRLRECNYGSLNGAPVASLHGRRASFIDSPFPAGESYRDVVRRVASFLEELVRDHDGKRALIIGHSATKWSLDHLLNGIPLEQLVNAPFEWRPGWTYELPTGWRRPPVL
jgi:broad specificity phosphatase PhoE